MAMAAKCSGCGCTVSCIFAAQYEAKTIAQAHGIHVVLCKSCWDYGIRMWVNDTYDYCIGTTAPEGFREASLYWDEGGLVTGRTRDEMTWPNGNDHAEGE